MLLKFSTNTSFLIALLNTSSSLSDIYKQMDSFEITVQQQPAGIVPGEEVDRAVVEDTTQGSNSSSWCVVA
ncbi:hypothetical protein C8Q75DRAFT_773292 [Abortiporus biennis]|nr:hypothetical protein C8Q75DRAFT_773292 [Abortiporus biennis]